MGSKNQAICGKWIGGKATSAVWVDNDTILCNFVLDAKDITDAGYPNKMYLWKRGEPIEKAKKIFELSKGYQWPFFGRLIDKDSHPFLFFLGENKDSDHIDRYLLDANLSLQHLMDKHPNAVSHFIESEDAEHGSGADLNDNLDYWTNIYTFLSATLGISG